MMLGSVVSEVGEVKGKGEKEIRDGSDTLALIFGCQTMDSAQVYFNSSTPNKQSEF
jgi:hypothetical protein